MGLMLMMSTYLRWMEVGEISDQTKDVDATEKVHLEMVKSQIVGLILQIHLIQIKLMMLTYLRKIMMTKKTYLKMFLMKE